MTESHYVTEQMKSQFWEDGAVLLPAALASTWMDLVQLGIERNLRNPGPFATTHYEGTARAFFDDYCNYASIPEYRMLIRESPMVDVVYQPKPIPAPSYPGHSVGLEPGDPLRGAWFPQVVPRPEQPLW
jgi:hypothetical protein